MKKLIYFSIYCYEENNYKFLEILNMKLDEPF